MILPKDSARGLLRVYVATTFVDPAPTRNPNPYPVVLIERVDATVHITACSSNMAPEAPVMLNQRGAQQRPLDPISSSVTIWVG